MLGVATHTEPTEPPTPAGRSVGRLLLRGGVWVGIVQVLGTGCAAANQMLLARLLSPESLAAFFLIQSVVMVGAQLGQLGLTRPLTRLVAVAAGTGEGNRIPGLLSAAHLLVVATAALVAAIYWRGGGWLAEQALHSSLMATGTALGAAWIVALALQTVTSGGLRGLHRVGEAALVAESSSKILMTLALGAMLLVAGSQGFLMVLTLAVGVGWATSLLGLGLLAPAFRGGRPAPGTYRTLVWAGIPLAATGVVNTALRHADLWIVGWQFSQEEVALYGAAKRLIVVVELPLMLLRLVLPPVLAELHAKGEHERLQRVVRGSATLAGIPAILLLLSFMAGSQFVLGLAFGDFYRDAAPILTLLCVEQLVFVYVGPAAAMLLMAGRETAVMKITTSMGVFTVAAMLAGAYLFGFIGVAAGFVTGSVCHQLLLWFFARRLVGIRTDMDFRGLGAAVDALRRAAGR
jgi:O-antigen/teichoic acid export membrane protein